MSKSFRELQNAVQQTEDVFGQTIPYIYFCRYGSAVEIATELAAALPSRVSLAGVHDAAESIPQLKRHILNEFSTPSEEMLSKENAIVTFLKRYNLGCVDLFVLGRAADLASMASSPAQEHARYRAFGLVRRGLEANEIVVTPEDESVHPALDDNTTVTVLSWGRVLGLALTYEDVYALSVSTIPWKRLVQLSSDAPGVAGLIFKLLGAGRRGAVQPLPPLPALPEPSVRPALPPDKNSTT